MLLAAITSWASDAQPWEEASRPADSREVIRETTENEDIEIDIKDGWVYVTTSKPVTIRIFTILGQQITSETIPAGTKRIHIASRGIYILRAGTITRRITI